mgnify:CR=1 FL=1
MRNNSDEAIAITKRFFLAIDILISLRKIRGLNSFAQKYNINYWNLYTLRKEPERRVLKVEYLAYIVGDFNISPNYLLFGIGSMFKDGHL